VSFDPLPQAIAAQPPIADRTETLNARVFMLSFQPER
jgi:hypothetical protein